MRLLAGREVVVLIVAVMFAASSSAVELEYYLQADLAPVEDLFSTRIHQDWDIGNFESEDDGESAADSNGSNGDRRRLEFGGWVQGSYHNESTGLFNTDPDRFNFQQVWFFSERVADGSSGPDWGFRIDFLYGTDSGDTQSFGNTPGRFDFLNGFDREGAPD